MVCPAARMEPGWNQDGVRVELANLFPREINDHAFEGS